MTRRGIRRRNVSRTAWVAMLVCAAAMWGGGEARGQMPNAILGPNADPFVVAGYLKLNVFYAEQAIGTLQRAASSDEVKRAGEIAARAYLQLNAAAGRIQIMLGRRTFPDPLLQQSLATVNRAREVTRGALAKIQWAAAAEQPSEHSAAAIELLREVIVLAQQAADLL